MEILRNPDDHPLTDPPAPRPNASMSYKGAYAALCYMASAVLLVMFNKAALSSYDFPYVNVITLLQMLSSCLLLYVLNLWEIISFTAGERQSYLSYTETLVPLKTLFQTLPLALSYLLYMLITMESVRVINVPMYTTLRRTTVAFTMVVEYLWTGQRYSPYVIGSVAIVVLGAFIAGARDFSFDAYGYSVVFIANICTAVYLASIARIAKSSGLNSFGLMWCNGIICGPFLLLWTSIKGDIQATMKFHDLYSSGFQVVMLFSCIMAFLINYFVFLNTSLNSALAQTVCGNMKDLFTIGLGWMLFGGLPFDMYPRITGCWTIWQGLMDTRVSRCKCTGSVLNLAGSICFLEGDTRTLAFGIYAGKLDDK